MSTNILITGASTGFGRDTAETLALDSLSLFIDTIDVLRYVKGERQPFLALHA